MLQKRRPASVRGNVQKSPPVRAFSAKPENAAGGFFQHSHNTVELVVDAYRTFYCLPPFRVDAIHDCSLGLRPCCF